MDLLKSDGNEVPDPQPKFHEHRFIQEKQSQRTPILEIEPVFQPGQNT